MNTLLYGKSELERVVSIEDGNDYSEVFIEDTEGNVKSEFIKQEYWVLTKEPISTQSQKLEGNLHYKFLNLYDTKDELQHKISKFRKINIDFYKPGNNKECALLRNGITYFKGMKHTEPSILSFDIETTSLDRSDNSFIIMISNTFRRNGVVERKLFCYDEYDNQGDMILAWCDWVQEKNPSILCGHNIYMYDLPYIQYIAENNGVSLNLGRDGSAMTFDSYMSKFRKEQNMFFEYQKARIYGREVVDTMFLAYKYDIGRKYNSYGLKNIVKQENLEVKDRVFYDAATIRYTFRKPEELEKIKQYAIFDADDSLSLYDLMCPSFFYMANYIPKPYQEILCSASGSQINALMVRSYLQDGHSIPKASPKGEFEGAISYGNPGIFKNCIKWDVASLYPSIMITYEVYDKVKDPKKYILSLLEVLTKERLKNKKIAKETGDPYFDALQNSAKVLINSFYGFLGAEGLNFNCPAGAAYVTKTGREILNHAIVWATNKEYNIINESDEEIDE